MPISRLCAKLSTCFLLMFALGGISAGQNPTESIIYSFQSQGLGDGYSPHGGVIFDKAGNLYSTTEFGGTYGYGTVFRLAPPSVQGGAWTETVLYSFQGGNDGSTVFDGVIFDHAGSLYGTTINGGGSTNCPSGCGTVFQLSPPSAPGRAWTETVLYSFQGNTDAANPYSGVIFDHAGNLYGATNGGGNANCFGGCGTVFQLVPPPAPGDPWTETVLYAFQGFPDGWAALASLALDKSGNLFGTTNDGGVHDLGTVFELSPPAVQGGAWTETVLHSFGAGSDGSNPEADLIFDQSGNLYGTTVEGGGSHTCNVGGSFCGTVFKLTRPPRVGANWNETVLYRFNGLRDGGDPISRVVFDNAGNLYGTTNQTRLTAGSVFKLTPPIVQGQPWTETTLHDFGAPFDGAYAHSPIAFGDAGVLYGATAVGGANQAGTVYTLTP